MRRHPVASAPVILLRALLIPLVAGCTGIGDPRPLVADITIEIVREEGVPPGRIQLKPIPGGIAGTAIDVPIARSLQGAESMLLPAAMLERRLHEHAAPVGSDARNPGELANPRTLRMARLGTFFEPAEPDGSCAAFSTGLRAGWPVSAILVYVDRAGTIRGSRYHRPRIATYELHFPRAGLYLVGAHGHGLGITYEVIDRDEPLTAKVRHAPCD